MIRWPGRFKKGLKVDALVELVDLAPTLLEAAGIPVSAGVQGRSLMPLLTGQTAEHRDSVYMEYFDANATYEIPPMLTSVRTNKWKLNYCDKPRTGELYDLEKDPGEFNNLWGDPHVRDAQEMMMHTLVGRMIETTDPLPVRHTAW
jgi:arylsulfatase A-like enzyme